MGCGRASDKLGIVTGIIKRDPLHRIDEDRLGDSQFSTVRKRLWGSISLIMASIPIGSSMLAMVQNFPLIRIPPQRAGAATAESNSCSSGSSSLSSTPRTGEHEEAVIGEEIG